jgi:hypothetical protein
MDQGWFLEFHPLLVLSPIEKESWQWKFQRSEGKNDCRCTVRLNYNFTLGHGKEIPEHKKAAPFA